MTDGEIDNEIVELDRMRALLEAAEPGGCTEDVGCRILGQAHVRSAPRPPQRPRGALRLVETLKRID